MRGGSGLKMRKRAPHTNFSLFLLQVIAMGTRGGRESVTKLSSPPSPFSSPLPVFSSPSAKRRNPSSSSSSAPPPYLRTEKQAASGLQKGGSRMTLFTALLFPPEASPQSRAAINPTETERKRGTQQRTTTKRNSKFLHVRGKNTRLEKRMWNHKRKGRRKSERERPLRA